MQYISGENKNIVNRLLFMEKKNKQKQALSKLTEATIKLSEFIYNYL